MKNVILDHEGLCIGYIIPIQTNAGRKAIECYIDNLPSDESELKEKLWNLLKNSSIKK